MNLVSFHLFSFIFGISVTLQCLLFHCRLSQCNIEHQGCYHLATALQKNSSHLKVLDLSINMVGDKGANELLQKFDISKLKKLE